jgi:hypothetical protein
MGSFAELWKLTLDAINAAEQLYPEAGKGKDKLALVVSQVQAYAPLIGFSALLLDRLVPVITVFANAVVARYNANKTFTTVQS